MRRETLAYHADGLTMTGQLFFEPASGPRAGVLVFPEAFGLGEHAMSRAERLAALGYVALACDLHGDGRLIDDLQQALGLLEPLYADPSRIRAPRRRPARARHPRRSRPGTYRRGRLLLWRTHGPGTGVLELGWSGAALKAVVGFHSGIATSAPKADAHAIKARILVCIGADDPMIPLEQRAAFEAAIRYRPEADACSWAPLRALFSETPERSPAA